VAISVAWQTTATFTTTTSLYTVPSSGNYGTYARDLVITNSGTAVCYVSCGTAVSSAVTTSSFVLPAGGTLLLTQCQVPASSIIYGVQYVATTTSSVSIGYATNVAFI
jgi:hypothetical protein